jgi:hypothetical protein
MQSEHGSLSQNKTLIFEKERAAMVMKYGGLALDRGKGGIFASVFKCDDGEDERKREKKRNE